MSDANQRISNYTYGIIPSRVQEDFTAKKPAMVASITDRFAEMYQIEQLVKGVLASEVAVTCISNAYYQAFAKEIYKVQRTHPGGAQLNGEVALLVAKWKGRGLTEAVLIRIRNECFSIPAPVAPGP
jgi:hypothetical protein